MTAIYSLRSFAIGRCVHREVAQCLLAKKTVKEGQHKFIRWK